MSETHPTIYAMIPARFGSTRLPLKNLASIGGHPLVSFPIRAAIEAKVFDSVVLNGDHEVFSGVAERYEAAFYLRPGQLGGDDVKSDFVVADFLERFSECDILAWVNPIAPLQTATDIRQVVSFFLERNLDSLITSNSHRVHGLYSGKPINFEIEEKFAQTQSLEPVELFNYAMMMVRRDAFERKMAEHGSGMFCGSFSTFELGLAGRVIVKSAEDLLLAESLLAFTTGKTRQITYDFAAQPYLPSRRRVQRQPKQ